MSYWAERRIPAMAPDDLARVPPDIPRWKVAYWQFQYVMTQREILPFLARTGTLPRGGRLLEVGAGEGGCLAALTEATRLPGDALELSASRAALAERLNEALTHRPMRIVVGDIADAACLNALTPPYSLVLLRDVIEHVEALPSALSHCHELLGPRGAVLFTFPPYFSPYGAHQQILTRAVLRLPWLQLLPFFVKMVGRLEPNAGKREEIEGLARCRLTISRFGAALRATAFETAATRYFLIRPAFRYRYGLPVLSATGVGRIPGVRELLVTGAWVLLRRKGGI